MKKRKIRDIVAILIDITIFIIMINYLFNASFYLYRSNKEEEAMFKEFLKIPQRPQFQTDFLKETIRTEKANQAQTTSKMLGFLEGVSLMFIRGAVSSKKKEEEIEEEKKD